MDKTDKVQVFLGMDIGGTLSKLCIWFKTPVDYKFDSIEDLKIPFKKGELLFRKTNNKEIESLFKVLHDIKSTFEVHEFFVTGGGSYKYEKELLEIDENY